MRHFGFLHMIRAPRPLGIWLGSRWPWRAAVRGGQPRGALRAARPLRALTAAAGPVSAPPADDTIFALASGRPPSAIAIVRVSGPAVGEVHRVLCRAPLPEPRRATLRALHHPSGELLDHALVLYFPERRSYSGEAMLELHVHGSPAVIRDVLEALAAISAARTAGRVRPALPGEFSRRAFAHGRMDLFSAEALDALLRAETTTQRRLALAAGHGRQARAYEQIRTELRTSMAYVEALLDFSDQDGVDDRVWQQVCESVRRVAERVARELGLGTGARGARRTYSDVVQHGFRVALYGWPNAGKSSLLNSLARRDVAIVSTQPGTTRDVVEVALELQGFKVLLADTAGLREHAGEEIERIGMERTDAAVRAADLPIYVAAAPEMQDLLKERRLLPPGEHIVDKRVLDQLGVVHEMGGAPWILVNKLDLVPDWQPLPPADAVHGVRVCVLHASATHSTGIPALLDALADAVGEQYEDPGEAPLVTQARHRHLLTEVLRCLEAFLENAHGELDLVVAAEELRAAAQLLGQVSGSVLSSHEVLGEIFGRFCVGK